MKPLRVCRICGLEAQTEDDLSNFILHKDSLHGRQNLCKECNNKMSRKGGKYFEQATRRTKRWIENNPDKWAAIKKKSRSNRIRFRGKEVRFDEAPRTNKCSNCGKVYPDELDRRTCLHHLKYDLDDPLAHTIELCTECHARLHRKMDQTR